MVVRHSGEQAVPFGERRCDRCKGYRKSTTGSYVLKTRLTQQWVCEFCLTPIDKKLTDTYTAKTLKHRD